MKIDWFEKARFGMFIHWGHISQVGGELSWLLVGGENTLPDGKEISVKDYHAGARTFNPYPRSPKAWLELARKAGMRYAVLTTKHHDGFALYPTRESDYSIEHTLFKGDVVREFVDAAREQHIRVGFYFSLPDWHHPDYPAFTDEDRPYSFGEFRRPAPEQWNRYIKFMFAQIRELLTQYGTIDLIWFDGGWERFPDEWHARELHDLVRSLQPDIRINDRLPGFGDFETPEQFVPPQPPERLWETCLTMNETWGYNPADHNYKSARDIVHALCETAGRGGNLLLNVSPMGNGGLPPEQIDRLEEIAGWMDAHGESILDTEPGLEPWQFYGPSTKKGNRIYAHLLLRPYETVTLRGVYIKRVLSVKDVGNKTALEYTTRCSMIDKFFNADPLGELIIQVPESLIDPLATVIEVEFDSKPVA